MQREEFLLKNENNFINLLLFPFLFNGLDKNFLYCGMNSKSILLYLFLFVVFTLLLISINWFWPHRFQLPVLGMSKKSYDQKSFWYYPWGKSVTHKGVDIFAQKGTPVVSSVPGFVVYSGNNDMGGEVILILGPKMRTYYYAHLKKRNVGMGKWVTSKDTIGWVGDSGNAKGKPPHLHFSISTLVPIFSNRTDEIQGDRKIWYVDPTKQLNKALKK